MGSHVSERAVHGGLEHCVTVCPVGHSPHATEFVKASEGERGEAGGREQIQGGIWSPLMREVMN